MRTLAYQSIGRDGAPWPAWLGAMTRATGVYVIRDATSKTPLYVGSSKGRLYATVTRHFQQWKRKKNWWKGAYGAGHDPGMTYQRARCEVAIALCGEHERLAIESELIAKLRPIDNLTDPSPELEPAPF